MIANLHIQTALRGNITYLQSAYFTAPFKVADITEDKKTGILHLMIMCSSPGILDGDRYQFKITLAKGCSLQLYTQSYQRLFNMKESATQALEVYLPSNSSFCFLPHPCVPHANAVFKSTSKFHLSENCNLVFGEILTCGRKLNGEIFQFAKYHNITEVFLKNKLVVKENLLVEPAKINLHAIGQLEGFTHQASLIYLNATEDMRPVSELINEYLSGQKDILFGITAAPVNGLIIRILGNKAEQLHTCLKTIASLLPQQLSYKQLADAS